MLIHPTIKRFSFVGFGRIPAGFIASTTLGLLIVSLVISGCAMVGPDYVKPAAPEPEQWLESNEPEIKTDRKSVV